MTRKIAIKNALKISKEFSSKVSLHDLLETHSWILAQEGYNPYAGIKASKKTIACYEISQQYGGPEEGGWWFNCCELDFTVQFSRKALQRAENACEEESRHSRYSYYEAIVEYGDGGENETKERPIYC